MIAEYEFSWVAFRLAHKIVFCVDREKVCRMEIINMIPKNEVIICAVTRLNLFTLGNIKKRK